MAKKYKVIVPLLCGRGKMLHKRGEIVTDLHFPEGNAAELEAENRLLAIDDEPQYDSNKSMAEGVSVSDAKAHLATLNTASEIDDYIDSAENRKGVEKARAERLAELDSQ